MHQGQISLSHWDAEEFLLILGCWVTLGVLSLWFSMLNTPRMPTPIRIGLSATCGLFAAIVGAASVWMILLELSQGQPHGPSPLWMGLLGLPFALLAAVIMRWLRRSPPDSHPEH